MDKSEKIIRLPAVKERCGLSRSTIYLRIAAGEFPKPIPLGARSIGFLESEINAWVAERVGARRRGQQSGAVSSVR